MVNNVLKELVAFYNVENLFSPDPPAVHPLDPTRSGLRNWDERKYRNKIQKVAQVFELIREAENALPMIIGFSEIQGQSPLDELAAMSPFNSEYDVVHYDSMDERGVDVALLYNRNKLELISSEPLTYFFEIKDNNPANYDTTRDILRCKFRYSGEIINVFVLHLPSKREKNINKPKREFILNDIREKVIEIKSDLNEAIIICGDFNENPDDDNVRNLVYDDQSDKLLENPFLDLYLNNNYSTYHHKHGLLFDQILLSKQFFETSFPLNFSSAKIFNHYKLSNWDKKFAGRPFRTYAGSRYLGGYSDHFPVITAFTTTQ